MTIYKTIKTFASAAILSGVIATSAQAGSVSLAGYDLSNAEDVARLYENVVAQVNRLIMVEQRWVIVFYRKVNQARGKWTL